MIQADTGPTAATSAPPGQAIRLSGAQNIRNAAQLRSSLLQVLEAGGPLQLDLTAVDELDAGALQVLLALAKSADAQGRSISFSAARDSAAGQLLASVGVLCGDARQPCLDSTKWNIADGVA